VFSHAARAFIWSSGGKKYHHGSPMTKLEASLVSTTIPASDATHVTTDHDSMFRAVPNVPPERSALV
jgi:hypothetical protein